MDITQHLATTLKALRQARGWSLSGGRDGGVESDAWANRTQ